MQERKFLSKQNTFRLLVLVWLYLLSSFHSSPKRHPEFFLSLYVRVNSINQNVQGSRLQCTSSCVHMTFLSGSNDTEHRKSWRLLQCNTVYLYTVYPERAWTPIKYSVSLNPKQNLLYLVYLEKKILIKEIEHHLSNQLEGKCIEVKQANDSTFRSMWFKRTI